MSNAHRSQTSGGEAALPHERVDYETEQLERSQYVTAVIHLYRGEVSRANAWRLRLDQTTNWAVLTTASALGFAFGSSEASHLSLQFANLLIVVLMFLEARRFRFFDVWRSRIRMIEENFFAPILERQLTSPTAAWSRLVANDLHEPHFHVTKLQALRLRLARNYLPIFAVLLVAWLIKLDIHPEPTADLTTLYERCGVGAIPPVVVVSLIGGFYLALLSVFIGGRMERRDVDNWDIGELVQEEIH